MLSTWIISRFGAMNELPIVAGVVSTLIFAASTFPMLWKALRTRDLQSYSLGNLMLANAGNAVHSVYVFSLPAGPMWALHMFNELTAALMLVWFVRFRRRDARPVSAVPVGVGLRD